MRGVKSDTQLICRTLLVLACGVLTMGQSCAPQVPDPDPDPDPTPPTAVAGPDQTVLAGATVVLNGTGSSAADGGALTYLWTQTAGTPVIINQQVAQPLFVAPSTPGLLTFMLTVTGAQGQSASDTVNVTVNAPPPVNQEPTASAGPDQAVTENTAVTLVGSGTDPDGDTLTYLWTQKSGTPTVTLTGADTATASFTAPPAPATLVFTLTVNDGKGGSSSDDVTVTVDAAPKTVDDIVLTPMQLSVPLSTFDVGNYSVRAVLVGNSIYFGNNSNTAKPQFFVRYDIASQTFSSPLPVSTNVCACGYESKLVTDGVNVFYIANDATKYTASSNTWSNLSYPTTAKDNAGEAGVAYYNGRIYFVGGRTPSNLFKYYSISQNQWFTVPNYLYATRYSQMAVYQDRIYVLGGQGTDRKFAYFSTSTNVWTPLMDTPFDISISSETRAAVLGNNLFLLQSGSVYIYDLVNNVWAANPVTISDLPAYANLFSDGQNLYIAGKNSSNTPAIYRVMVTGQ